MQQINHWIDGRAVAGSSDRSGTVHDPSTGELTATVRLADSQDVDDAVAAAQRAFKGWAGSTLAERQDLLFNYRALLTQHCDDLARLVSQEHGKTFDDARGEVLRGIEVVDFVCGLPELLKGDFSAEVSAGIDTYSLRQPVGVVAGITPFNFPAMVPMWMFPVAIACGNTFILKPSERDPSASLRAAELFTEAGLPDGVLNVLQGDRTAAEALVGHPDVSAISFVGSTPVAQSIYTEASRAGKRVQALGGAKNHMVVMPDADLEAAVDAAISAGYGSAGERCMAISVIVAVGDVADTLVERLAEQARAVVLGAWNDKAAEMGPLITEAHRERVAGYAEQGLAEGAELLVDGRNSSVPGRKQGFWFGPTLFDHVEPGMAIYRDEIFGPVLSVVRRDSLRSALELVNGHGYGNGAAIFTRDGAAARTFEREVEAGMVGVNVPIPVPRSHVSFGGWNGSMLGAFDIYGPDGIRFYTRQKKVTSRWTSRGGRDLSFRSD